jgi:hypothetical protein
MHALGVRGYPTAVLVDASGTVVWKGHPSQLDEELVGRHVEGAFQQPVWAWPKSCARVRKALEKREYGKALAELSKLEGEDAAKIRAGIESIVARRMQTLEKARSEGDYLGASEMAEELQAQLKGLPAEEARAAEIRAALRDDENAKRVIKLQQKLRELMETRLNTADDIRDLIVDLQALADKASGTHAAKEAQERIEELREMLRR